MAQPLILLHQQDPKKQILDAVMPYVKDIRIRPYDVMLCAYMRENIAGAKVTASGIHLSDKTLVEDRHQGKVNLVMKVGEFAFTPQIRPDGSMEQDRWGSYKPAIGDWVVARVSDPFKFDIPGGWQIRILDENLIQCILPDMTPDFVW